ncbi:autotransporter outer membrane beta-barrel domain-containing protein [Methylovulum miyakonense]|uniref:hypothetical protein n=1 Tax=Methylovulum miyakonense TaxID=645578 RepID=UPI00037D43DF|nr:hypothetical protein [Methylovulum miyakonense]
MGTIGAPKTSKAAIGACELRIGTLANAGRLTSDQSVGVVHDVKLDFTAESYDFKTGYMPKLVDSATTHTLTGFTCKLQEASRRNLNFLLGNLLEPTTAADVCGNVVNPGEGLDIGKNLGLWLSGPTGFSLSAGDIITIYAANNPGRVSACVVSSFTAPVSPATYAVVDIYAASPLVGLNSDSLAFPIGSDIKWFKTAPVSGSQDTPASVYYSMQLVQLNRVTGFPVGYNFWKTFIVPSLSLAISPSSWATIELRVKSLRPYPKDYTRSGSPLNHLAARILTSPVFEMFDVPDVSRTPIINARIRGSVLGDSTVTGGLTTSINLAGDVSGDSIIVGDLTTSIDLAGDALGGSTVIGNMTTAVNLAGGISGDSIITGDLTTSVDLAGSISGDSTATGDVTTSIDLAGDALGDSTIAGDLTIPSYISGDVSGDSTITGDLTTSVNLAGVISGDSTITGDLTTSMNLAGGVSGDSTVTGDLTTSINLAGGVSGDSTITGDLTTSTSGYRYFWLVVTTNNGASTTMVVELKIWVGATQYPTNAMTSDSGPGGYTSSASSNFSGSEAFHAFDRSLSLSNRWRATGNSGEWLAIDIGAAISPTAFWIAASQGFAPKDFILKGNSVNNLATATTIKSITNETDWGAPNVVEERGYTI